MDFRRFLLGFECPDFQVSELANLTFNPIQPQVTIIKEFLPNFIVVGGIAENSNFDMATGIATDFAVQSFGITFISIKHNCSQNCKSVDLSNYQGIFCSVNYMHWRAVFHSSQA